VEQIALNKMIEQLRKELGEMQYAIHALEALASGKPRRGRPPKILADRLAPAAKRRKSKTAAVNGSNRSAKSIR